MGFIVKQQNHFTLPKHIDIFGTRYKVKVKENLVYRNQSCYGLADIANTTIWIEKNLSCFDKIHTFFHECFHCVLYETGHSDSVKKRMEEPVVDTLAKFIGRYVKKMLDAKGNTKVI